MKHISSADRVSIGFQSGQYIVRKVTLDLYGRLSVQTLLNNVPGPVGFPNGCTRPNTTRSKLVFLPGFEKVGSYCCCGYIWITGIQLEILSVVAACLAQN
jgi:hypothetical protein